MLLSTQVSPFMALKVSLQSSYCPQATESIGGYWTSPFLCVQGPEQGTEKSLLLCVFEERTNERGVSIVLSHHEDAPLTWREASLEKHKAPFLPWDSGWQGSLWLL